MISPIDTRSLWVVTFEGFDSAWIDFGDSKEDAVESAHQIGWDKPISGVRREPVIASRALGLEHPRHRAIPNEAADEIMLRVYPYVTGCGKNIAESWVWHRWSEYEGHASLLCADCIPGHRAASED
ncbi:MAG: hypothetical protein WCC01_01990 [Acidimicrobiia bacterium]